MKELNLLVERVNNSVNGIPRFKILKYDDREILQNLISKGKFRVLKDGSILTKINASWNYGFTNKQGFILEDILIKARTVGQLEEIER